jgi:hypothetical protein
MPLMLLLEKADQTLPQDLQGTAEERTSFKRNFKEENETTVMCIQGPQARQGGIKSVGNQIHFQRRERNNGGVLSRTIGQARRDPQCG